MKKKIVTIGREYGSGGYEVGKKLAEALGWKFYDRELIAQIAEKTMVSEEFVEKADEVSARRNIFLETFPIFVNDAGDQETYIFNEQGKFICELAEKGNCVIIGRRADYYLRDNEDAFHIFLYADLEFRAKRIAETFGCTIEEAKNKIASMDKKRKTSYEYTTGRKWGNMHSYDRMICTSTFGVDATVEELVALLKD